tara:strand:+ start:4583 stop:6010 length:1428 start_codon:yes stop_codon:yes gene_type:complete
MRDIGYSLETAIADLIDNSISANARNINVVVDTDMPTPYLALVDDGCGMSDNELIAAMKHGSANANDERHRNDLGRFGLGLKTASFSQCRRLTVATRRHGEVHAAEWDLDLVDSQDKWVISILSPDECDSLPERAMLPQQGTLVIWRKLDRVFEDHSGAPRDELVATKLSDAGKHLSLVFHRYLSGEMLGSKLSVTINGHALEPFDPFCRSYASTQILPKEIVRVGGHDVLIQPYILPHHSKLSTSEYEFYQARSNFISNQGAYVYRCGRLMAWGDWFRLIPKGEATKLARVQIDFPNALDEQWTIDIKKSKATPPRAVRERIRQIIERISQRSTRVHKGRGRRLFTEIQAPLWQRFSDRGSITYSINRQHALVRSVFRDLPASNGAKLEMLLKLLASSMPLEMIYADLSENPKNIRNAEENDEAEKLAVLDKLWKAVAESPGFGESDFADIARSTRLFENCEHLVEQYLTSRKT